jgi:hypothetical protein
VTDCKQCSLAAALTSPSLHARGCASPSPARRSHKNIMYYSMGPKLNYPAVPPYPPALTNPSTVDGRLPSDCRRCFSRISTGTLFQFTLFFILIFLILLLFLLRFTLACSESACQPFVITRPVTSKSAFIRKRPSSTPSSPARLALLPVATLPVIPHLPLETARPVVTSRIPVATPALPAPSPPRKPELSLIPQQRFSSHSVNVVVTVPTGMMFCFVFYQFVRI